MSPYMVLADTAKKHEKRQIWFDNNEYSNATARAARQDLGSYPVRSVTSYSRIDRDSLRHPLGIDHCGTQIHLRLTDCRFHGIGELRHACRQEVRIWNPLVEKTGERDANVITHDTH